MSEYRNVKWKLLELYVLADLCAIRTAPAKESP